MTKISLELLINAVQSPNGLSVTDGLQVLDPGAGDLPTYLAAAYHFREMYFKNEVTIHILNNVQNGLCPEDCRYCAQSKSSDARIETYPMKPDDEIFSEAEAAYKQGAGRYCMVFSGTGPSDQRIERLCAIIRRIKGSFPIEVCVSPGVINAAQATRLKAAGLDRLNHNLNTSERYYSSICTSHSFNDRVETLRAAKTAGLAVCSGVIVGMGETAADIVDMAMRLKEFKAESIPVNFFMPVPGAAIKQASDLTPEFCLRVLCLFRLINPSAELRMAAGREMHLRSLEAMGLYAANSLFMQGYLNVRGATDTRTLEMIRDAGFSIKSDVPLDELLANMVPSADNTGIKTLNELRPFQS